MKGKNIMLILILFCIILSSNFLYGFNDNSSNDLEEYMGPIEHLTFNTLMAFPEKALDPKNQHSNSYDENKITPNEFENILLELYNNNFVLIDIDLLYKIEGEEVIKNKLFLPKNKKPIILSFNNVTYKSSYQNLGSIDKLIIDRNNNLATYTTKKSIQDRVQYNNEFMLILENFIKKYPHFSFQRAKGIMFFSGENGILGYNTNSKNSSSKNESKRVNEVIQMLKMLGWKFGSNNYKYIDENNLDDMEFVKELSIWNNEIRTLVGPTPLYAYPYGIKSNNIVKSQALIDNGFRIFFTNDNFKTNLQFTGNTLIMSRREISGSTLRNNTQAYSHLFDCEKIYDHLNRQKPFNNLTS